MEKDIVSVLLGKIQAEFNANTKRSKVIKAKIEALKNKSVTHKDSNDFAIEVGNVLKDVFKDTIKSDVLPDNKMYYDVAKGILEPSLKNNYDLVVGYAGDVQAVLNRKAGINIAKQIPKINQERIDNLVEKISEYDNFEDAKWLLDEPVVNFTQSIVDDVVKENVEFQYQSGLKPKIIRREAGSCCEWCSKLAGTYDYPEGVPKDVWRRHRYCRCTLEHITKKGIKRVNNDWNEEKNRKKKQRELYKKVDKLDKTKRNINKQTIKEIEEKNWNPEFKARAIKFYRNAHKKKVEFSSHAIARGLDRAINKAGLTEEDLINIAKSKPKYTQGSGRLIYCSKNIYLVRDMETGDFVSIVERDLPRNDWRKINE